MSAKTKPMRWHVHRVGNVELHGGKFVALDLKDRVVGKFATLFEALNSIKEKCNEQNKSSD
jgi:hypothetical protein